jgi:regulatory protein
VTEHRLADPVEARKKAMDYLARREYGRAELAAKLEAAGFDATVAGAAIAQLVDDGLQSDARYVGAFVRSRIDQGKGPVRIRADLRARGIDDCLIEAGITDCGEDWAALARQVRSKKFGTDRPLAFSDKARQMRFLQARGFDGDQIRAAVSAMDE